MYVPRLLVSVKDYSEVAPALEGGAEIIDIKNPELGSLGMANLETMGKIVEAVKTYEEHISDHLSKTIVISSALGETIERLEDGVNPVLPSGISLVKMGTAGLSCVSGWKSAWKEVCTRISTANNNSLKWVAVSYVDWDRANSPEPAEIIEAAVESDCAGVLFDTFQKDSRHLLDWLLVYQMTALIARIHDSGLFAACAGKVHAGILDELTLCQPDVIAIRSAGCTGGIREATIDVDAVSRFKESMTRVGSARSSPL